MFITVLSVGLTVMDSSSKRLHVSKETVVFQILIMAVNVNKINSKLTQVDNQLFDKSALISHMYQNHQFINCLTPQKCARQ